MESNLWKSVCVVLALLLHAPGSFSQLVCGQAPFNTKIVGGQDAGNGAWPWQVSIQVTRGSHFCGGSLISQNWVLSAAHCFQRISSGAITIQLGLNSLQSTNANMQSRTVAQIINHPSYNDLTNDNDIALVQLSSPVTFNDYIRPVCLASSDSSFSVGTYAWVTGWGTIRSGVSLPSPQNLQEVAVPIVSNSDCAASYGPGSITSNMMCAGLPQGGKDSCQGDSGGPLVNKQNSTWIQGGIVSFGEGCALPNFPGVYTRVSQYQNWINSEISSNHTGFREYSSSPRSALFSLSLSLLFCTIPFLLPLYMFN